MIATGYSNEQIMHLTSLTIEQVLPLRAEFKVECCKTLRLLFLN